MTAGVASAAGNAATALRRLRRAPMLRTPEEAMAAVSEALIGFLPNDAAVSEDGRLALAVSRDGRVAVVTAGRRRASARVIGWTALRQTFAGIEVDLGDRRGKVVLTGVDALAVRRLVGPAGADRKRVR